ncbi:MAG: amidohydrolase family protein [Planctomycetota bacterium]|nr:amidohydrolase family protein [Planctomycetota bacterium]
MSDRTLFQLGAPLLFGALSLTANAGEITWEVVETAEPVEASAPVVKLLLSADKIYTAAGDVIDGGTIAIAGSKIAAVVPGASGDHEGLHVGAITPGMVDLSPRIHLADLSVEESSETIPYLSTTDGIDLFDKRWERLLRTGVTSVMYTPADEACIGGMMAVLKTGGEPSIEDRLVEADVALRGAFGSHASRGNHPVYGRPTDHFSRRPTTRMGTEWVHRKSFYDALAAMKNEERQFEGWEILASVLEGERPYFVQASATQDIRTAIYLKEEVGLPLLVVDAAAEAWKEPGLLVRSGTAAVLPPHAPQGRTAIDNGFLAWNTAKTLVDLGVPVALSSHGQSSVTGQLGAQAGYAMRGGLTRDEAIAAVTITPARLAGVDDRVGSIEVGKDADLILWSGEPFAATSRVVGVVLNGEVVFTSSN